MVSEWAAWARCDPNTEQQRRARSIIIQPEGGNVCPLLEEASACSLSLVAVGEKPPILIDSFLYVWDCTLQALLALLAAKVSSFGLGWWRVASGKARWAAGVTGGILFALTAAIVFVTQNETICMAKRPFAGRAVFCHGWARSAGSGFAELPAYAGHVLSTIAVAVFNVPRRTVNAAIAQLAVVGSALAVCAHHFALSARWVGVSIAAPCALLWAAKLAWVQLVGARPARRFYGQHTYAQAARGPPLT